MSQTLFVIGVLQRKKKLVKKLILTEVIQKGFLVEVKECFHVVKALHCCAHSLCGRRESETNREQLELFHCQGQEKWEIQKLIQLVNSTLDNYRVIYFNMENICSFVHGVILFHFSLELICLTSSSRAWSPLGWALFALHIAGVSGRCGHTASSAELVLYFCISILTVNYLLILSKGSVFILMPNVGSIKLVPCIKPLG